MIENDLTFCSASCKTHSPLQIPGVLSVSKLCSELSCGSFPVTTELSCVVEKGAPQCPPPNVTRVVCVSVCVQAPSSCLMDVSHMLGMLRD